jgi:hypothetical protein
MNVILFVMVRSVAAIAAAVHAVNVTLASDVARKENVFPSALPNVMAKSVGLTAVEAIVAHAMTVRHVPMEVSASVIVSPIVMGSSAAATVVAEPVVHVTTASCATTADNVRKTASLNVTEKNVVLITVEASAGVAGTMKSAAHRACVCPHVSPTARAKSVVVMAVVGSAGSVLLTLFAPEWACVKASVSPSAKTRSAGQTTAVETAERAMTERSVVTQGSVNQHLILVIVVPPMRSVRTTCA